jgi:hypothetical protein
MTNNLKTVALLAFMSALVWWLGIALFGGSGGFYIGLIFAVGAGRHQGEACRRA